MDGVAWATDGAMLIRLGDADEHPEGLHGVWLGSLDSTRDGVQRVVKSEVPELGVHLKDYWLQCSIGLLARFTVGAETGYVQEKYLRMVKKAIAFNGWLTAKDSQSMIFCMSGGLQPQVEAIFMPINKDLLCVDDLFRVDDVDALIEDRAFYFNEDPDDDED